MLALLLFALTNPLGTDTSYYAIYHSQSRDGSSGEIHIYQDTRHVLKLTITDKIYFGIWVDLERNISYLVKTGQEKRGRLPYNILAPSLSAGHATMISEQAVEGQLQGRPLRHVLLQDKVDTLRVTGIRHEAFLQNWWTFSYPQADLLPTEIVSDAEVLKLESVHFNPGQEAVDFIYAYFDRGADLDLDQAAQEKGHYNFEGMMRELRKHLGIDE